ncbi:MAG: hypothetical protein AAGF79_00750 [Pseudomonadota bacterium]
MTAIDTNVNSSINTNAKTGLKAGLMPTRVMPTRPQKKPMQRSVRVSFDTGSSAKRVFFQITGTLLILTSAAVWILPDPQVGTYFVIMKLLGSLFFMLCGLALLMRNHDEAKPEVHFDARRRELRVTQRNNQGRIETLVTRGYDSFGAVYVSASEIELWNSDGTPFLTLPVPEADLRSELRTQFGSLCA